ncbi:MAG TPA: U32 family peptidase, partial [Casimicrobiaceae bacterium]
MTTRISLGPILYYWPRAKVDAFYDAACESPADIVYLGEVVCGKRHELGFDDWIGIGRRLAAAGKEVVLSCLALTESETDLRLLRRLVANGEFAIEANDMGAVGLAAQARVPFVIGPHVNAYNPAALEVLIGDGATRWVAPIELPRDSLAAMRAT